MLFTLCCLHHHPVLCSLTEELSNTLLSSPGSPYRPCSPVLRSSFLLSTHSPHLFFKSILRFADIVLSSLCSARLSPIFAPPAFHLHQPHLTSDPVFFFFSPCTLCLFATALNSKTSLYTVFLCEESVMCLIAKRCILVHSLKVFFSITMSTVQLVLLWKKEIHTQMYLQCFVWLYKLALNLHSCL